MPDRILRKLIVAALPLALCAPAAAGDLEAGRSKARACVLCHGPMGLATNPGAPHLAGQPRVYLAEELKNYRSGKRQDPVMSVIAKPLTDSEIEDLAAWYASIEIELKPR
ncbi:MAG TPA: cytochrome c [Burkholderiaceae bacterium]|nr:cytochrome c [Burkholderiaceae bacterium]